MIAACGQHLGHHVLLADMGLVDVLDRHPGLHTDFLGTGANALAQRLGKTRVVEDADAARLQDARHPRRVACPGQGTGNDDSVVARQYTRQALPVTLRQQLGHCRDLLCSCLRTSLTCLVPAPPA